MRHIPICTEMGTACPRSPHESCQALSLLSGLVAGRLEFSSVLRHQASPLEERGLQSTDLRYSALGCFFKCVLGPYASQAWAWLTYLPLSSRKSSCGLVQLLFSAAPSVSSPGHHSKSLSLGSWVPPSRYTSALVVKTRCAN